MTASGKNIVDDFASLPDSDKPEVLANLLRISRSIDYPEVSDEELRCLGRSLFFECDRQEAKE